MRGLDEALSWLLLVDFVGYEGEGDDSGGDSGDDSGAGDDDSGGDDDSSSGDSEAGSEDVTGLKSALTKERRAAKEALRKFKAAEKRLQELDDQDKSEVERARKAEENLKQSVVRLGERLRNTAIDSAIKDAATSLKFKDVTDALSLTDRSDIEVDQDEDDPSDITVNAESVKKAVKALAEAKKHLIDAGGEEDPSGSKFGGGQKGNKGALSEEALRERYSALR